MSDKLNQLLNNCNNLNSIDLQIEQLNSFIKSYPNHVPFYRKIILLYKAQNKQEKVKFHYNKLIKNNSMNRAILIEAMNWSFEQKEFDQCQDYIERLLSINPDDELPQLRAGQILKEEGFFAAAEKAFQNILESNPNHIGTITSLSDTYIAIDKIEKAQDLLEKTFSSKPNNYQLAIRLGRLEKLKRNSYKACAYFRLASFLTNKPSQKLLAKTVFAEELIKCNYRKSLLEYISDLLIESPSNIKLLMLKAKILSKEKELDKAEEIYNSILAIKQNHKGARIELVKINRLDGDTKSAIKHLELLLIENENDLKAMNILGNTYESIGKYEKAFELYSKAIQVGPNSQTGYLNLAQFLIHQGEHKQGLRILAEAKSKVKNNYFIDLKLIKVNGQIGNVQYALNLLENLIEKYPNDDSLLFLLAKLNKQSGNFKVSLNILNEISPTNDVEFRNIEKLKADIHFLEYNYKKSEDHFLKVISITEAPNIERVRLSLLKLLDGKINEAEEQLKISTREIELQNDTNKVIVPLLSHSAKIINAVKVNPKRFKEIKNSIRLRGKEKLKTLGKTLRSAPTYFGSALFLSNEIRKQGILKELRSSIEHSKSNQQIPKTIIQYWDERIIPKEVSQICRSWKQMNPEFEYKLFSKGSALAFIENNYAEQEVKAFNNCTHPAMQADFFRLAYLNKFGGFYADADDKCLVPLDDLSEKGANLVLKLGDFGCFGNNFIACTPEEKIINHTFECAVENLTSYYHEGPWFKVGPGHLTMSVCNILQTYFEENDYSLWPKLFVLDQSEARKTFSQHLQLNYKKTEKSWFNLAYMRQINKAV